MFKPIMRDWYCNAKEGDWKRWRLSRRDALYLDFPMRLAKVERTLQLDTEIN